MQVELRPDLQDPVASLVEAGEYASPEAVIEAALDAQVSPVWADTARCEASALDSLDKEAEGDLRLGRTRVLDEEYAAEMRARAKAIIASKPHR